MVTIDTNNFFDFVGGELLPQLQPFDGLAMHSIVIMDNLSVQPILTILNDSGIVVHFLPPYSPDLNPIEEAFSYIKSYLKLHEDVLDATNDPFPLIHAAIDSITSHMCKQWITHSGYQINQ